MELKAFAVASLLTFVAAGCAQAAPSFGASSWSMTASRAEKTHRAEKAAFDIWAWLRQVSTKSKTVRTEAADQNPESAAEPKNEGVVGDEPSGREAKRPAASGAEKDDAREKAGPELIPFAF